jgi:hypothetical protein
VKKSGSSNGSGGVLKLATPQSRRLRFLAEAGIIVPGNLPADDENIPLDFTRLSFRGIGELQSRYAVRHAHALYNLALLDSSLVRLRRDLRISQAKFRIRHKDELKNISDAMMEEDEEISEYRTRSRHRGQARFDGGGRQVLRQVAAAVRGRSPFAPPIWELWVRT